MDIKWDLILSLPGDVSFLRTMYFVFAFSTATLIITGLARLFLKKDSSLKNAITSALAIIMLYSLAVCIYALSPRDFSHYLNQLPMGHFTVNDEGQKIFLLNTLQGLSFPALCHQLLRIFLLAVMINWLGTITPANLKGLGWTIFRMFTLGCAIFMNYALVKIIDMFMPFVFQSYAPMIILSILAFSFGMGLFKFLVAMVLTVVNPLFLAFYGFFFNSKFGKCLSRSIGTTVVIVILVHVFQWLGYGILPVGSAQMSSYLPFFLSMFLLWSIVGRKM